jgi:hypothetical protein
MSEDGQNLDLGAPPPDDDLHEKVLDEKTADEVAVEEAVGAEADVLISEAAAGKKFRIVSQNVDRSARIGTNSCSCSGFVIRKGKRCRLLLKCFDS